MECRVRWYRHSVREEREQNGDSEKEGGVQANRDLQVLTAEHCDRKKREDWGIFQPRPVIPLSALLCSEWHAPLVFPWPFSITQYLHLSLISILLLDWLSPLYFGCPSANYIDVFVPSFSCNTTNSKAVYSTSKGAVYHELITSDPFPLTYATSNMK